jgi:NADPH-dependent 2,4-dienoyl-CoA reductase/sulfur reductase-like enzyme
VAVVGGGWAGFGATKALVDAGAEVVLLDASAQPGGLSSAFSTPQGRVIEPGIKGWEAGPLLHLNRAARIKPRLRGTRHRAPAPGAGSGTSTPTSSRW